MGQAAHDATHAMSRRAEALLRALVGVHEAEVSFQPGGAAHVRVAAAGSSSGLLIRNIRSALLAGLGVAVDPPHIELVDPAAWVRRVEAEITTEDTAVAGPADAPRPAEPQPHAPPGIAPERAGNARPNGGNGHGHGNGQHGNGHAHAERREPVRPQAVRADALLRPAAERPVRPPVRVEGHAVRVERVEIVRHAGRLRCRVVIRSGAERYSAIADTGDEPGAEIQLAGRVTCDALRAGGLTTAQFESATVAYLGGRIHVVVALGDWRNGEPQPRSGSVVAGESLEEAAARAVLQAALAEPTV